MSLDIYIAPERRRPAQICVAPSAPRIAFDDDAYYWFLWPLFLKLHTCGNGELVDLYGNATFSGSALGALRETLAEARQLVLGQPASWKVVIGNAGGRDVVAEANRTDFLNLLDDFDQMAASAEASGQSIICIGD